MIKKPNKKHILTFVRAFLILATIALALSLLFQGEAQAEWFNDHWGYRKQVSITNSGSATTNQYVKITLDTATLISSGKMQSDCDDIRVTNYSGKILTHFIDGDTAYNCNQNDTAVYVLVDSIPTSGTDVFMYYGNPSAENVEPRLGTSNYPGISCRNILEHANDSSGDGQYYITPTGNSSDKIEVTCDMSSSGGGWALVFHGLPSEAMVLNTTNESIKLSNNIIFNDIRMEGVNLNFNVTTTTTETAQLSSTIPQYYYEVDQQSDGTSPRVNFHDLDGNQDVLLSNNYFMFGYGNSWRVFYTCINVSGIDNLYIGGYTPSCTPRSSFVAADVGCTGSGDNYCGSARSTSPVDSGLGLSLYEYQETKVWTRENDITLNIDQSTGSPGSEEAGPGPVAYWKFDEGYGQTTNDSTEQGNNGTLGSTSGSDANDPTWVEESRCLSGKCLQFDGTGDYVNYDANILDGASTGTVSMWFKRGSWSENYATLLTKSSGASWVNNHIQIARNGGDDTIHLTISDNTSSTSANVVTGTINENQWYHIAMTWDGVTLIGYLDGVEIDRYDTSIVVASDSTLFAIGKGAVGTNRFFNGFIDEVKIYPYARSAVEIKADYANRGAVAGTSASFGQKDLSYLSNGLVGYWKMDDAGVDAEGEVITDSSGNGNSGTLYGDNGVGDNGTGMNCTASGKYGTGCDFDGVDDYVDVGDTLDMGLNDWTISGWVKVESAPSSNQYFVSKSLAGTQNYRYAAGVGTNGAIRAFMQGDGGSDVVFNGDTVISDGGWHFATIIYNRDGNLNIFVDGDFDKGESISHWETANMQSNNPFRIGSYTGADNTSAQLFFGGKLDDVRIYNRALSPKEVRDMYNWAPGPVGYWKMDEKSTASAYDSSGNNVTLSATGLDSSNIVSGKYGSAYYYNTWEERHTGTAVDVCGNATLEAWIYPKSTPSERYTVIHQDGNQGMYLSYGSDNAVHTYWYGRSSPGYHSSGSNTVPLNQWSYITATWDGDGAKVYVNGILKNSVNSVGSSCSGTVLKIGAEGSARQMNGYIDDVRIYNYARTQKQITEDMNGGHPIGGSPIGSQVGYWKFDEGYGIAANDSSPQGKDGIINNATWTNDGKFGKALSFDGTGDYVDTTVSAPGSGGYTFTAWTKTTNLSTGRKAVLGSTSGGRHDLYIDVARPKCRTWDTSEILLSASSDVSSGEWVYLACTMDFTNGGVYFYVNGVLQGSSTRTPISAGGTMYIGDSGSTSTNDYNGIIDEVKFYNSVLTEDEVRLDYNQGKSIKLGSTGTESNGSTPSDSASREYCVPGDTSTCNPPVAEWKFDEKTGANANDTSGNGNTGTITGATWKSSGECKEGACLSFNGSNTHVDAGINVSDTIESAGTIEMWVYPTSIGGLFSRSTGSSWSDERIVLHVYGGLLDLTLSNGTSYWRHQSTSALPTNQWTYVTVTWDGSNVKHYFNGKLDRSQSQGGVPEVTGIKTWIGRVEGLTPNYHTGQIDSVKLYDYARTPAQIAWDYNRGKPIGHWKLDECQGTTAYDAAPKADSSQARNDGTITIGGSGTQTSAGTCASGNSAHAWSNGQTGKRNASLNFDGTDDFVDVGDMASLEAMPTLSVSAWVKTTTTGTTKGIVTKWYTGNVSYALRTHPSSAGKAYFSTQTGGSSVANSESTSLINDGQWHHIVGTYDGTNQRLYVDGILEDTDAQTGTITNSEERLLFGAMDDTITGGGATFGHFNGQIDDVRIYNYALTGQQVKTVMNDGAVRFGPSTGSP